MCGICGTFGTGDIDTVKKMLPLIHHRGPDDEHVASGERFCIGARRLSIIDVAGGRQPLCNEDGSIWVAQNGEIYNFPSLRETLLEEGHNFSTRCDTEVLVHLYESLGDTFYEAADGLFAISLWDEGKKRGILARDRTGKKPLYYTTLNGNLYFASEIKCLLKIPGYEKELNREALHYFLSYKHVPHPLTIFKGISMLPPGSALFYEPGEPVRITRYWQADFSPMEDSEKISEEELSDMIIDTLREAVRRRLISDVPIGFFLSGGLDSSLSTALAAESSSGPIKTFTLVYGEEDLSEGKRLDLEYARQVSDTYGTEHHEEVISSINFKEEYPRIISHFDEPFSGVISTYFLARLIGSHVKVALSGDGADELFGSYLSHRIAQPIENYINFEKTNDPQYDHYPLFEDNMDFLKRVAEPENWKWRYKLLVFTDEEKQALYSPAMKEIASYFDTQSHLGEYFRGAGARDATNRILEAEFRGIFPDQVLAFVDRLSMAHSLEVRTAFLDPKFVRLAAGIPGRFKIKDGEVKYILKKAALKYLPREIAFRKKEGFVMPINNWLLDGLKEYVSEALSPGELDKHGLFNPRHVQGLLGRFYEGDQSLANKVFSLLAFQVWYDIYMG